MCLQCADHNKTADARFFGSFDGADKTLLVDLDGAVKTIEAAEKAGIRRFIMVSTLQAHRRENWSEALKPYYVCSRLFQSLRLLFVSHHCSDLMFIALIQAFRQAAPDLSVRPHYKHVFVVGANGQIGRRLTKSLNESDEHQVRAMVRNEEQAQALKQSGTDIIRL